MPNKTWKNAERRVAELVGSKRKGPGGGYDVVAGDEFTLGGRKLGIEVKYRKTAPAWLVDAMKQAVLHQSGAKFPSDPIVVLLPKNCEAKNGIAVMSLGHYLEIRSALKGWVES